MSRAWALAALSLAAAFAGQAEPVNQRPWPQRPGRIQSVAGGEVTLAFAEALERVSADIGATPAACRLDAARTRATCGVPATLGPGLWPVDVEYRLGGRYFRERSIVELRVPAIVKVTPVWVSPGATIEIDLEAPLPNGDSTLLIVRGPDFERAVPVQQLRPARLRARLPSGALPRTPILQLRVRDLESAPWAGILANRWVSLAVAYGEWIVPGLLVGALAAVGVVLSQPARRRGP